MNKIEKLIVQLHDLNFDDINIDMINFYKTKYDLTLFKIENLKIEEPLKIFKSKHKKWEKEMENLNNDLNNCYIQIKNIF